jgi:cell division transport system permease protein
MSQKDMSQKDKPKAERPLLPREDGRDGALVFVVFALCFLAVLAALGARAASDAANAWSDRLEGQITVRLLGTDLDDAKTESAAAAVRALPTISSANPVSRAEAEALLKPWLGAAGVPDNLPLPRLIAIEARPNAPSDLARQIENAIIGTGITARVDDHGRWSGDVRRTAETARSVALGALSLLIAVSIAVIVFASHAALLARRDVVEALHLMGATDGFVAGLFQRRFAWLGLQAGLAGAIAAILTALAASLWARGSGADTEATAWLLPTLSLTPTDGLLAAMAPIISALTAMLTARIAVMRALARQV